MDYIVYHMWIRGLENPPTFIVFSFENDKCQSYDVITRRMIDKAKHRLVHHGKTTTKDGIKSILKRMKNYYNALRLDFVDIIINKTVEELLRPETGWSANPLGYLGEDARFGSSYYNGYGRYIPITKELLNSLRTKRTMVIG